MVARVRLPEDVCTSFAFVPEAAAGQLYLSDYFQPHPDDLAPLRHPFGADGAVSVLEMPSARRHPAWNYPAPHQPFATATTSSGRVVWLDGDRAADHLVVLVDGAIWAEPDTRFGTALAAWRRTVPVGVAVAMVDTPDREVLADRAAMVQILSDTLHALDRDPDPACTIVAGQSYGGLAAAGLLVDAPQLVGSAVSQSGSFWFVDPDECEMERPGTLITHLRGGTAQGRLIVQAGAAEGPMLQQSQWLAQAASTAGISTTLEVFPGGHDYAWYRHGLLLALDQLLHAQ